MNKSTGLDYEIVPALSEDGFNVWTPDDCGAIIGHGETEHEAARDAIANLEVLLPLLKSKYPAL